MQIEVEPGEVAPAECMVVLGDNTIPSSIMKGRFDVFGKSCERGKDFSGKFLISMRDAFGNPSNNVLTSTTPPQQQQKHQREKGKEKDREKEKYLDFTNQFKVTIEPLNPAAATIGRSSLLYSLSLPLSLSPSLSLSSHSPPPSQIIFF